MPCATGQHVLLDGVHGNSVPAVAADAGSAQVMRIAASEIQPILPQRRTGPSKAQTPETFAKYLPSVAVVAQRQHLVNWELAMIRQILPVDKALFFKDFQVDPKRADPHQDLRD